jgi:ppGpp synthetase/RelA/SpoT-type nucleotidyltranferase
VAQKPTYNDYIADVTRELGFLDETAASQAYEFNIRAAKQALEQSSRIIDLYSALSAAGATYAPGRPELLLQSQNLESDVRFGTKPFKSVIDKLHRRNVLYNRRFPDPPLEGGITPLRLYEDMDDLIRTRIICKYMDAPRFLCLWLSDHCNSKNIQHNYRELSTDAGYYAWHFYFKHSSEIMLNGSVVYKDIWVEVQFATQLSEVLTLLTHELYKNRRVAASKKDDKRWKWDPGSSEFRSAYLGHGLHLLEGLIKALKDELVSVPIQNPDNVEPSNITAAVSNGQ